MGPKINLHPIFSVVIKDHIPKALAFGQSGDDKDIHTFGLYDGVMYVVFILCLTSCKVLILCDINIL